jgi:hypothetical protein
MCTTPTNAVEALVCLSPLELVVQCEVRATAHNPRVWEAGLTFIPIEAIPAYWSGFNSHVMGVDVMRPAYNFEPKYRVTMLTRKDWTKGTGTPPVVKGLIWFTDGSEMQGGLGLGSMSNL